MGSARRGMALFFSEQLSCSKCHAGLGTLPEEKISPAQLELAELAVRLGTARLPVGKQRVKGSLLFERQRHGVGMEPLEHDIQIPHLAQEPA